MCNALPDYMGYIQHLFAEHERLQQRVEAVHADLAATASNERTTTMHELTHDLEQLRGDLADHFAEEEEGACLEEAVSRNPSLGPQADRVQEEHKVLLDRLEKMIHRAKSADSPIQAAKEIAPEFGKFVQTLHAHERSENQIMERGFNIDLDLEDR